MKTLAKTFALALSMGIITSVASFSEAKPITRPAAAASYQSAVYTTKSGQISVALDKQKGGIVDVRLVNANGDVLYNYRLSKNQSEYRKRLNVSELPDGVYQVEITNGTEVTKHTVTIATQQPTTPSRMVAIN
ncbi:hypothetical protein GCM10028805_34030 [Spirosoma harenae]